MCPKKFNPISEAEKHHKRFPEIGLDILKLGIKLDRSLWSLGTKNFLFNNILLDLDL
jgi:hypothetical protein